MPRSQSQSQAPSQAGEPYESKPPAGWRPGKNCAECRRLKVKCDRKVPCSACIRRGCANFCPGESFAVKDLFEERQTLLDRIRHLEGIIDRAGLDPNTGEPLAGSSSMRDIKPVIGRTPTDTIYSIPSGTPLDRRPSSAAGPSPVEVLLGASTGTPATASSYPPIESPSTGFETAPASVERRVQLPSIESLEAGREAAAVENSGTLVMSGGRSKYLGGSAMPLWLSEGAQDATETRPPSPARSPYNTGFGNPSTSSLFGPASVRTYTEACDELPSRENGWALAEANFRHLAWGGTALSRQDFADIFNSVFDNLGRNPQGFEEMCLAFQRLASVYIVLALGTLVSLELPLDDPTGMHYFQMARQCLVNGRFLTLTTLIGVQSVSLMGRYCTYASMRGGWDLAWQLRGLSLRLVLAMGLHRDGESWDLSTEDVNNRRRVFWEVFSHDVFFSRCWDRPTGIAPDHYDTRFPDDCYLPEGTTYELQRYKLSILVKQALDESLKIQPSSYSGVVEIWQTIVAAEEAVPYNLRCRATARVMVSRYATTEAADAATPEPSRKDVKLSFQQHALTLDYCAGVFLLLRPYFVRALESSPSDPTNSPFADAYLAVIERSSMMIAMLRSIHSLFPLLSTRHWQFWSHAFSSAVCMATVCVVSPTSALVPLAMAELESVISLLQSILNSHPRRDLRKNLDWLLHLREKAVGAQASLSIPGSGPSETTSPAVDANNPLSLVGWRTRLIQLGQSQSQSRPPVSAASALLAGPTGVALAPEVPIPQLEFNTFSGLNAQPPSNTRQAPDEPDATAAGSDMSLDFLQQLLGVPVGLPFPMDLWTDQSGQPADDYSHVAFDLQNFMG